MTLKKSSRRIWLPLLTAFGLWLACRAEQPFVFPAASENTSDAAGEAELFTLRQNSPNPFSSSTLIRFELKKTVVATLRVSLHSHTVILFSGVKEGPATHYFVYAPDPSLPNGNYRYSLEVNGIFRQRAMTLQR